VDEQGAKNSIREREEKKKEGYYYKKRDLSDSIKGFPQKKQKGICQKSLGNKKKREGKLRSAEKAPSEIKILLGRDVKTRVARKFLNQLKLPADRVRNEARMIVGKVRKGN